MAFREIEIELQDPAVDARIAGPRFVTYEVEATISVRDGEVVSIEIEGAREIREMGEFVEVALSTAFAAELRREVESYVDDSETRRELEQEDIEAARSDHYDRLIDEWKERR